MSTKKSKINLFEGILQIIFLLVVFFGKIADYTIEGGKVFDSNLGISYIQKGTYDSIYFKDFFDSLGIFAALIIILSLCNLVMCFVSAFSKNTEKDGIIHTVLPIITFVLSIFVYKQGVLNITISGTCFHTPVTSIVLVISFIVIILSIFKRSKFIASNEDNH